MNKNIYMIKLGKGKKKILYCGAFHANEWITSMLLVEFIREYCNRINEKNNIYNDTCVYIIPMLNPDGVDLVNNKIEKENKYYLNAKKISDKYKNIVFPYGWKANINGVKLKNFQPNYKSL